MHAPLIRFDHLAKRFDDRTLFTGLSYAAGPGSIAIEGDTGTGKTTLLRLLAGEATPDSGDVFLAGHSLSQAPREARASRVYVPEDLAEYPQETGRAFLERMAASRQVALDAKALALAEAFGLTPHLDKRFAQMSFGTRKKVLFTAMTIGRCPAIIADEPTSGLDTPSRRVLADVFRQLARDRAVFFTSYDEEFVRATGARVIRFTDMRER